jgi:hypothetical protein
MMSVNLDARALACKETQEALACKETEALV